eukprot:1288166-Rhodomonas_salina.2
MGNALSYNVTQCGVTACCWCCENSEPPWSSTSPTRRPPPFGQGKFEVAQGLLDVNFAALVFNWARLPQKVLSYAELPQSA